MAMNSLLKNIGMGGHLDKWLWVLFFFILGAIDIYLYVPIIIRLIIRYEHFVRREVRVYLNPYADFKDAQPPMKANVPLSVERKYETRFESISFFRHKPATFPIERALKEYHREPIAYALALAELNTEVIKATRTRNEHAFTLYINTLSLKRRNRDVLGNEDDEVGLTILQLLRYSKIECSNLLNSRFGMRSQAKTTYLVNTSWQERNKSLLAWKQQLQNFVTNVNFFCQHTGSEVDDLAPSQETINNLRKFGSDRRQELAPLLKVNADLTKESMSYKRINAALQTRHTIEKLTFELPDTTQYDLPGSGPKWQVLWEQIWANASGNVNNPFHNLWTQSTGPYARDNIRDKGRKLFADMSGEIHGYDQRPRNTFDYEHFDVSARRVAKILHEEPIVDQRTGDVDWAQEIRKYPIAWPDANDLALTLLGRLEGRVANLQRRLDIAVEERDRETEHQAEIQAAKEAGEELRQQRRRDREAYDSTQNDFKEDDRIGAIFDAGE
ncbi:hypothetical protein MMC27_006157 [Xylographa pallens]|nr:hypothetical protein [Xylographa pallens]